MATMISSISHPEFPADLPVRRSSEHAWAIAEQVEAKVAALLPFASVVHDFARRNAADALQSAKEIQSEAKMALAELTRSSAEMATKKSIGQHVAMLISSYPNAGKAGTTPTYGRVLADRVGSRGLSQIVLELSCLKIIDTIKFPPSVAEVVEIVEGQTASLRSHIHHLVRLPEWISKVEQSLVEADRRITEMDQRCEARFRRQLLAGERVEPDSIRERDLLAKIRAEMNADAGQAARSIGSAVT